MLTRRTLIASGAAAPFTLAAPAIVSAQSTGGPVTQRTIALEHGTVKATEFADMTLHSYSAPELGFNVATHIVETPERLVFIDGQRSIIHAQEMRAYAETTGKPVDRMIVTHLHPDHWFGAYQFRDAPIHAFAETAGEIAGGGATMLGFSAASLGEHLPPEAITVTDTLAHGATETIDGIPVAFRYVQDAEADHMMMVELPDQRVLIAQDVLYNDYHLFIGGGKFDEWIAQLDALRRETRFDLILPGHGGTQGGRQGLDHAIRYLEYAKARRADAEDGAALKAALMERYPTYAGEALLDLSMFALFPQQ